MTGVEYSSTASSITISASPTAVSAADNTSLEKYKLTSSPGTASPKTPAEDMEITGLTGGTLYTLTFKGIYTCTDSFQTSQEIESADNSDDYKACTRKSNKLNKKMHCE